MTPTEQDTFFQELEDKHAAEIALAFIALIAMLRLGVNRTALVIAIRNGDLEAALDALNLSRSAYYEFERKLEEAFIAAGQGALAVLGVKLTLGFHFNVKSERSKATREGMAEKAVMGLLDGEREMARQHLSQGMQKGASVAAIIGGLLGAVSKATGRRSGGLIGLSFVQRQYALAAAGELESADPKKLADYLARKQRNPDFDAAVRRAVETGKPVDKETARRAVEAYQDTMRDKRAEAIARVIGLPMIDAARVEAFQQLVDEGRVEEGDIERRWLHVGDNHVRNTHRLMGGQRVRGLSQPFISPSGAKLMYPRDTSLGAGSDEVAGCRCRETITIRR